MLKNGLSRCTPVVAGAAIVAFLAGCQETTSPIEPIPTGNVAGEWTGKFDSADPIDCDNEVPAQASFQQDGSAVVGTIATESVCGFRGVTFQGTLKGNHLSGTVTGGGFASGSGANGYLSEASLELAVFNSSGYIPGGQMHLHR